MIWTSNVFSWIAIAGGVFVPIGFLVFLLGWRGKRIDDHPVCRKCGYDLFGLPENAERCPECGSYLTHARAVRIGNRRRNERAMLLAMMLVFLGSTPVALLMTGVGYDIQVYKPLWWLRIEANQHGTPSSALALDEVIRRMSNTELSQSDLEPLFADAFARQLEIDAAQTYRTAPSVAWDTRWSKIVEGARDRRMISEKDWATYARHAVESQEFFVPALEVKQGEPITFTNGSHMYTAIGGTRSIWINRLRRSITLGGQKVYDNNYQKRNGGFSNRLSNSSGGSSLGEIVLTEKQWATFPPGEYPLIHTLEYDVLDKGMAISPDDRGTWLRTTPPLHSGKIVGSFTLRVLPAEDQAARTEP